MYSKKSRRMFFLLICKYTSRQSHHNKPAVHRNDVLQIHRPACKARSAFIMLNSFPHYLCITILLPSFGITPSIFSFALVFNNSIIFFCLAWPYSTPSFHVPLHRRLFGVSRLCMSLEQTSWLCFCLLCSYFDSVLLWLVLLWSAIAAWLPFCYTETLHSSDA